MRRGQARTRHLVHRHTSDDVLDLPITTPDQGSALNDVLDLDVTRTPPQDLPDLSIGIAGALSTLVAGQAFLGGLANRVSIQQGFNASLVDALTEGVGSLVDADNYGTNMALYPRFQEFFRERKPPALIVWGVLDPDHLDVVTRQAVRDEPMPNQGIVRAVLRRIADQLILVARRRRRGPRRAVEAPNGEVVRPRPPSTQ